MAARGGRVISCDPLYQFTAGQIRECIDATYDNVIEQTRRHQEKYVWDTIRSVDELGQVRMAAMRDFLADYGSGRAGSRYLPAELPHLPFSSAAFDLALCSHFLFLYSDNFSLDFHARSIDAMCRVAREVRLFPLLDYNADRSPFVDPLIERLTRAGHRVTIEIVPYEFQRGGNQMMRIA